MALRYLQRRKEIISECIFAMAAVSTCMGIAVGGADAAHFYSDGEIYGSKGVIADTQVYWTITDGDLNSEPPLGTGVELGYASTAESLITNDETRRISSQRLQNSDALSYTQNLAAVSRGPTILTDRSALEGWGTAQNPAECDGATGPGYRSAPGTNETVDLAMAPYTQSIEQESQTLGSIDSYNSRKEVIQGSDTDADRLYFKVSSSGAGSSESRAMGHSEVGLDKNTTVLNYENDIKHMRMVFGDQFDSYEFNDTIEWTGFQGVVE